MRATLADVLEPARRGGYAVAGLVCLGWEDARAYADAAADAELPVILQVGPSARAHTPLAVWGAMLGHLADRAPVPVVVHLDHGASAEECRGAIAHGFTSVMFDGSALPLGENIARTRAIVHEAHAAGVSCEGEIGFVGYAGGAGVAARGSQATDSAEARRFAEETGVDAMAVAVGNVHLQSPGEGGIDRAALDAVAAACPGTALVIHGGSGVAHGERRALARGPVAKFNIGTELRQTFGRTLREVLARDADAFDRTRILAAVEPALREAARAVLENIGPS